MRARTKVRKTAQQALDPSLSFDGIGSRTLPPVLTAKAVVEKTMPPLGVSALPTSLEEQIPAHFRFWKAATLEDAISVRDALVESGLIKPANILKVDGELRRVNWEAFLAVEEEPAAPVPLVKRVDVALAGAMRLAPIAEPVHALALGELEQSFSGAKDEAPWTAERVSDVVKGIGPRVCIALSDTPEHRAALAPLASTFTLATRPGVIFGSPLELDSDAAHVATFSATVEKAHGVKLLRKAEGAEPAPEERFVFGVVLEPDVIDSQNDTYSAEEVRKAAHRFMEDHAQLGQQHTTIVTGKLKILESYVAPVDFAEGTEQIKKGTWLLAIRVVDDALWASIKDGSFTGFSIGGSAIRQPEPTPPAAT